MMKRMKERLSLSVESPTQRYLMDRAQRETRGNVSALVDRLVRRIQLEEAMDHVAQWYVANPGLLEEAELDEAERYAS